MYSYVYLKFLRIYTGFLIHWTIKWFFPCVNSWVFSEIRRITTGLTLVCKQRDDEEPNVFLHNEQANSYSPVCTLICLTKSEFWLKDFVQTGHLKGFSSLCKSGFLDMLEFLNNMTLLILPFYNFFNSLM